MRGSISIEHSASASKANESRSMRMTRVISSAERNVGVPPPQPRRSNTVAVASVANAVSTVSQPTVSSHEIADGSRLPRTPKAARESSIVGADPRLPAMAMNPHSRNEKRMPATPATSACQNEMPKPRVNEP